MTITPLAPGFPVGARVRLVEPVEYYPLGIWPAGTTGTVAFVNSDGTNPAGMVTLDEHFEALNDWDNQLQVCPSADEGATWASWEAIP